jgi:hypothetical protein
MRRQRNPKAFSLHIIIYIYCSVWYTHVLMYEIGISTLFIVLTMTVCVWISVVLVHRKFAHHILET